MVSLSHPTAHSCRGRTNMSGSDLLAGGSGRHGWKRIILNFKVFETSGKIESPYNPPRI
jgi:hypothetical protein